jgi:integrase
MPLRSPFPGVSLKDGLKFPDIVHPDIVRARELLVAFPRLAPITEKTLGRYATNARLLARKSAEIRSLKDGQPVVAMELDLLPALREYQGKLDRVLMRLSGEGVSREERKELLELRKRYERTFYYYRAAAVEVARQAVVTTLAELEGSQAGSGAERQQKMALLRRAVTVLEEYHPDPTGVAGLKSSDGDSRQRKINASKKYRVMPLSEADTVVRKRNGRRQDLNEIERVAGVDFDEKLFARISKMAPDLADHFAVNMAVGLRPEEVCKGVSVYFEDEWLVIEPQGAKVKECDMARHSSGQAWRSLRINRHAADQLGCVQHLIDRVDGHPDGVLQISLTAGPCGHSDAPCYLKGVMRRHAKALFPKLKISITPYVFRHLRGEQFLAQAKGWVEAKMQKPPAHFSAQDKLTWQREEYGRQMQEWLPQIMQYFGHVGEHTPSCYGRKVRATRGKAPQFGAPSVANPQKMRIKNFAPGGSHYKMRM